MNTPLITPTGHTKLKKELKTLWHTERPLITEKVSWAASLGDRSENADYKENKAKLRQIDRRIRYLQKRLDCLKIITFNPAQKGKVFFGAWVTIENEADETKHFQIVGYDEIFDRSDAISIDSPMARALIKKSINDEAAVNTPQGTQYWTITAINYTQT